MSWPSDREAALIGNELRAADRGTNRDPEPLRYLARGQAEVAALAGSSPAISFIRLRLSLWAVRTSST